MATYKFRPKRTASSAMADPRIKPDRIGYWPAWMGRAGGLGFRERWTEDPRLAGTAQVRPTVMSAGRVRTGGGYDVRSPSEIDRLCACVDRLGARAAPGPAVPPSEP